MSTFKLEVITPEKILFNGETSQIIVKTTEGNVGIMARHERYVAILPSGPLKIKQDDGSYKIAAVSSGMIKVDPEKTTILANAVEWADEIDLEHAKRSKEDALKKIKENKSNFEIDRANLKLQRALNRINVYELK